MEKIYSSTLSLTPKQLLIIGDDDKIIKTLLKNELTTINKNNKTFVYYLNITLIFTNECDVHLETESLGTLIVKSYKDFYDVHHSFFWRMFGYKSISKTKINEFFDFYDKLINPILIIIDHDEEVDKIIMEHIPQFNRIFLNIGDPKRNMRNIINCFI